MKNLESEISNRVGAIINTLARNFRGLIWVVLALYLAGCTSLPRPVKPAKCPSSPFPMTASREVRLSEKFKSQTKFFIVGNISSIKKAVSEGADVNVHRKGQSPLGWAVSGISSRISRGDDPLEYIKFLVEHGADVNARTSMEGRNSFNATAADYAIHISNPEMTKTTKLSHEQLYKQYTRIMDFLIAEGANPNDTDKYCNTALYWGALYGLDLKYVQYLLDKGVDPMVGGSLNVAPIFWIQSAQPVDKSMPEEEQNAIRAKMKNLLREHMDRSPLATRRS